MKSKYYLEKLQKLPHRGVGTENENKAFEIIRSEYKKLNLKPSSHKFRTIRNSWIIEFIRHAIFIISISFLFCNLFLPGLVVFLIGLLINITQTGFSAGLLKCIFPTTSQNVFVEMNPTKDIKQTIVILGHVDTARRTLGLDFIAGLVGKKFNFTKDIDKKFPNFFRGPYFLTSISIITHIFAFIFFSFPIIKVTLLIITALIIVPTTFLMMHTMFSHFVPGAFDNGSGTVGVLTTASSLLRNKNLKHTRVIFLNNGSEESLTHGLKEFIKEANLDLQSTYFINLEGIGSDDPLYAYGETDPLGKSCFYDKKLYSRVERIIKSNKKYKDFSKYYLAVPTDCYELAKLGCRIMVTLSSLENDGYYSHYHKMSDTIEKINFNTIELCSELCIDIIEEVDRNS